MILPVRKYSVREACKLGLEHLLRERRPADCPSRAAIMEVIERSEIMRHGPRGGRYVIGSDLRAVIDSAWRCEHRRLASLRDSSVVGECESFVTSHDDLTWFRLCDAHFAEEVSKRRRCFACGAEGPSPPQLFGKVLTVFSGPHYGELCCRDCISSTWNTDIHPSGEQTLIEYCSQCAKVMPRHGGHCGVWAKDRGYRYLLHVPGPLCDACARFYSVVEADARNVVSSKKLLTELEEAVKCKRSKQLAS